MELNLKANPFFLDDEGVTWVHATLQNMSVEEKIGQIFCFAGYSQSDEELLASVKNQHIGSYMYRPAPSGYVLEKHSLLQQSSKIPLLLAANLESGGVGVATDATNYAKPLQCAAVSGSGEAEGYRLGKIACEEGAAVGCNWSFAPIVDIDMNFRNPITNLRTFGNNPKRVYEMAKGYLTAAKECGVAACIKHFPGDGVDERDQHLLTSVNSLSAQEWDASYGMVYGNLIQDGALTVMVGHIAQPEKAKQLNPALSAEEAHRPASLSPTMLQGLLRSELGFNGVIATDSSSMLGLMTAMPRKEAVPYAIAAGNDIFLFAKNAEEDLAYMKQGYEEGILTKERLNDAVTRILALKAALGLHTKQQQGRLLPAQNKVAELTAKNARYAAECADQSITLVKNRQQTLPLSAVKTKRLYLNVLEENKSPESPLRQTLKNRFEAEGFSVTVRDRSFEVDMESLMRGELTPQFMAMMQETTQRVSNWKEQYDLVVYVANFETASNNTVVRLVWNGLAGAGNDYPWFTQELPTIFISLANPYHLFDVPMMQTFINAYNSNEATLDALMNKLMGRSKFVGVSPVDAFCGRESTTF